jgi:hypothetical protein
MTSREEELLGRVEAVLAETARDAQRVARVDAAREEHRAEAARRGELGPDWRSVQHRIDAGDTSLAAVFEGLDETPAAVRLRDQAHATLEAMELPDDLAEELAALREALP